MKYPAKKTTKYFIVIVTARVDGKTTILAHRKDRTKKTVKKFFKNDSQKAT